MSTLETLQEILIKEFDLHRDQLVPEADLAALGVDSLDLLELVFKIEDRYHLTIRDDVPASLNTIGDLIAFIDGLLAKPGAARGTGGTAMPAAT